MSSVPPKKNVAYSFDLPVFGSDGELLSGATFSTYQISKDGGPFATLANAPTEIGTSGVYTIALTSTEMDAARVIVLLAMLGAPDITVTLETTEHGIDDLALAASSEITTETTPSSGDVRSVTQGMQYQGTRESIIYAFDLSNFGDIDEISTLAVLDLMANSDDVIDDVMTGDVDDVDLTSNIATLPALASLTARHIYRVDITLLTEGQTFNAFFLVESLP